MPVIKILAFPTIALDGLWKNYFIYIYIYPQVFAGWRGGVVHALVCLCEQEKTELSVDLSSCFRVATESCRFEKLIALQNLSLGTVKIGTVYLEQGSFLGFFIHTYTCPLQGVPLLSLHQTTLCKTTTDLFLLYHLVLSSFCSPQTITCLLSDFLSFDFVFDKCPIC